MGFFSWKTSDTNKSIPSHYSNRPVFTVHMITRDGQIYTEKNYDGYGDFGGKDVYVLLGELNGLKDVNDEKTRNKVFNVIFERGVKTIIDGKPVKLTYGKDFMSYEMKFPQYGNLCPNELVKSGAWKSYGIFDFEELAEAGYNIPKFVENLPSKDNWEKEFDALKPSERCPDQGFFYPDPDDNEDDLQDTHDNEIEGDIDVNYDLEEDKITGEREGERRVGMDEDEVDLPGSLGLQ